MFDRHQPVKLISLHQPYASLMAVLAKENETRDYKTPYRGQLVIQAAKESDFWQTHAHLWNDNPIVHVFRCEHPEAYEALHPATCRMRAVAVTTLTNCLRMTHSPTPSVAEISIAHVSEAEQAVGLYKPGRYAWTTTDTLYLPEPIKYPGHQGSVRDASPELIAEIDRQLNGGAHE